MEELEIITALRDFCQDLGGQNRVKVQQNPWIKNQERTGNKYLKWESDIEINPVPGIYIMEAIDGSFMYPKASNVYYIGRAKKLSSRLSGKLRSDFTDDRPDKNPRLYSADFGGYIYHYYTSTYYEYFDTNLRWFELSDELWEHFDIVEDVIISAFQLKYGSTPMCNKKSAKREICFNTEYSDSLLQIANSIF